MNPRGRRKALPEFGGGHPSPSPSPPPITPVTQHTNPLPQPASTPKKGKRLASFGIRKVASTPVMPAPEYPTLEPDNTQQEKTNVDRLGKILSHYVEACKRELIFEDMMRNFRDDPDSFLEEAGRKFCKNQLSDFLNKYTKRHSYHMMTATELHYELNRLCPHDLAFKLIEQIFYLSEQINAKKSMPLLLSRLDNSSINILTAFTENYNLLQDSDKDTVTNLIIDSADTFNPDYLLGILGYASTMMIEGQLVEKFPMRAAAKIAELFNAANQAANESSLEKEVIANKKLSTHILKITPKTVFLQPIPLSRQPSFTIPPLLDKENKITEMEVAVRQTSLVWQSIFTKPSKAPSLTNGSNYDSGASHRHPAKQSSSLVSMQKMEN